MPKTERYAAKRAEARRRYEAKHRERRLAYWRAYYLAHKEEIAKRRAERWPEIKLQRRQRRLQRTKTAAQRLRAKMSRAGVKITLQQAERMLSNDRSVYAEINAGMAGRERRPADTAEGASQGR